MLDQEVTRTKKVYINAIVTLISYILQIAMGFFVRKLFIDYLGVEYLGYNSVFQNVLQMLNLADLGIGVAITSFLYKPLAFNDKKAVYSLMYMYKKVYRILGCIVMTVGLLFLFIIQYIITDANCSIGYLRLLFFINLIGTVSTYFLAYKRTLLIADQKSYITSVIDTASYFCMTVMQIIILLYLPNYILFLSFTVGKNIISNFIVSVQYNRIYGRHSEYVDWNLISEYKPRIVQYVKDVFISKVGSYIYYSTDNIVISVFNGSLLVGYLSNYTLVTNQVNAIITQMLSAVQASFGNYVSSNQDIEAQKNMTDNYLCINFCIGNFCMICVMFLVQPFVHIIFGPEFVLEFTTAFLLAVNLMLTVLIQVPSQVFMIYKLYHYDRPIIFFSAFANIVISSVLTVRIGINGVLIGTTITSLCYLFLRMHIISKITFGVRYSEYVRKIAVYFGVAVVTCFVEWATIQSIPGTSVITFVVRMMLVGILAICVPTICLYPTREFKFFLTKIIPDKLKNKLTHRRLLIICIITVVLCVLTGVFWHPQKSL